MNGSINKLKHEWEIQLINPKLLFEIASIQTLTGPARTS